MYILFLDAREQERASQVALVVKNLPISAQSPNRHRFDPWVRKIPQRRAWQPTPVFLSGKIPWTEEPGGPRVGHD